MAEEFFLDESNKRWLKETRYRYVTEYEREEYTTSALSEGDSSNEGFVGEQASGSAGRNSNFTMHWASRYVPRQRWERDGQEDYTREDKIAKLAARLLALHAADVGISVLSATDVARDAADVVLLDKRLDAVATAVRTGSVPFVRSREAIAPGAKVRIVFTARGTAAKPSSCVLNKLPCALV